MLSSQKRSSPLRCICCAAAEESGAGAAWVDVQLCSSASSWGLHRLGRGAGWHTASQEAHVDVTPLLFHGMVGLEETLKPIHFQPLLWARTPPIVSGYPEPTQLSLEHLQGCGHPPYRRARASPPPPLFSQKDQAAAYPSPPKPHNNKKKRDPQSSGRGANFPSRPPPTLRWANTRGKRRPNRGAGASGARPLSSPGGGRLGCAAAAAVAAAAARKGLAGALPQGGPRRRVGPGRALCRRPARGLPGSAARRGGAVRCARGCGAMGR